MTLFNRRGRCARGGCCHVVKIGRSPLHFRQRCQAGLAAARL